jgi:hypothetical protein
VTCTSSHSVHAVRYFHSLDEREASSPGGSATRLRESGELPLLFRLKELSAALRGTQISGCSACLDSATFISRRNEATESTAHLEL